MEAWTSENVEFVMAALDRIVFVMQVGVWWGIAWTGFGFYQRLTKGGKATL